MAEKWNGYPSDDPARIQRDESAYGGDDRLDVRPMLRPPGVIFPKPKTFAANIVADNLKTRPKNS